MWERIKAFIFDEELYVDDAEKIISLHRMAQKVNIVIFFITLIAGFVAGAAPEGIIALLIVPIVAIVDFVFIRVILNIGFGWCYDIRILRMKSEATLVEKPSAEIEK
ncbi:MAG: hypothetical protein IJW61_04070 [Clostridia bacterium]|nr:hypothetical protein [Clostridia bacterium]